MPDASFTLASHSAKTLALPAAWAAAATAASGPQLATAASSTAFHSGEGGVGSAAPKPRPRTRRTLPPFVSTLPSIDGACTTASRAEPGTSTSPAECISGGANENSALADEELF